MKNAGLQADRLMGYRFKMSCQKSSIRVTPGKDVFVTRVDMLKAGGLHRLLSLHQLNLSLNKGSLFAAL